LPQKNTMPPRFTYSRPYINRSGSLSDPDAPELPEDYQEREDSRQAQLGEDDYHAALDAERGENT
jgi:hypothetical protein